MSEIFTDNSAKILVVSKQEASEIIGVLVAQMAGDPAGHVPSVWVHENGQQKYKLNILLNEKLPWREGRVFGG